MPILAVLGILFVGLKLTGYIAWSWWLVTLPFWGGVVVVIIFIIVAFLATLCAINKAHGV